MILTSRECLGKIDWDAAIRLIEAERRILKPDERQLTDLQVRCIQAIADDWFQFNQFDPSDIKLLQKQNPLVLTETLSRVTAAARQDQERLRHASRQGY